MPLKLSQMFVDPKEQNAVLQNLIGANKQRLAETQKTIRDLQKRAATGPSKSAVRPVKPGEGLACDRISAQK